MNILILEDRWKVRLEVFVKYFPYAVIARRVRDLKRRATRGEWDLAFLDYDLDQAPGYDGKNGGVGAKWIAQERPNIKRIIIHSTNDRGAKKIADALRHHYKIERIPFPDLKRRLKKDGPENL